MNMTPPFLFVLTLCVLVKCGYDDVDDLLGHSTHSSGIQRLDVLPDNQMLPIGHVGHVSVWLTYEDGKVEEVTNRVTWRLSTPSLIDINQQGHIESRGHSGETEVHAVFNGLESKNSSTVLVSTALVESLEIPSHFTLPLGLKVPLAAKANFSDGTHGNVNTVVDWTVMDNDIATIDSLGILSSKAVGRTQAVAKLGDVVSNTAILVMTDAMVKKLRIDDDIDSAVPIGVIQDYKVVALLSDGSEINVSDNPDLGWISNNETVSAANTFFKDGEVQAVGNVVTSEKATLTAVLPVVTGLLGGSRLLKATTELVVSEAIVKSAPPSQAFPFYAQYLPIRVDFVYRACRSLTDEVVLTRQ